VADRRLAVIAIADWPAHMEEWLLCLKARAGLHAIKSFFALNETTGKKPGQGARSA
jgi:hypothetical protein